MGENRSLPSKEGASRPSLTGRGQTHSVDARRLAQWSHLAISNGGPLLKPNQSFEAVYDFSNLYAAYRAARKGKRWKSTVAKVEANALEAVAYLQKSSGTEPTAPELTMSFSSMSRRKGSSKRIVSRTRSCSTPSVTRFFTRSSPGPLSWTTMVPRLGRAPISALTGSVTSCGSITAAMGVRTDGC